MTHANLKLSKAFYKELMTSWLIIGVIFVGLLWVVGLQLGDFSSFLSEKAIKANGVLAKSVKVSGEGHTTFPLITFGLIRFNNYDLSVVYEDIQG